MTFYVRWYDIKETQVAEEFFAAGNGKKAGYQPAGLFQTGKQKTVNRVRLDKILTVLKSSYRELEAIKKFPPPMNRETSPDFLEADFCFAVF
jgi:hypothetical protein